MATLQKKIYMLSPSVSCILAFVDTCQLKRFVLTKNKYPQFPESAKYTQLQIKLYSVLYDNKDGIIVSAR